jgi:hypothetical protein
VPYIAGNSRPHFDEKPHEAKTDGEVTYVLYKELLRLWKAEPRWTTYAAMRKVEREVNRMPTIFNLFKGLTANGVDGLTLSVAYRCAVDEIKRRFVDAYEDSKIKAEGDIE